MKPTRRPKGDAASLRDVEATETVHHVRSSAKRKVPHKVGELNLTAMLDVTFQLLIFFVLTASFAIGEGVLPADLPSGESPASADDPEPPQQPITIGLRSLGGEEVSIQLRGAGQSPANFAELYTILRGLRYSDANPTGPYNPDDPIVIRPEGTVRWGHVINAFNAATHARYTNVNFAQPSD